MITKCAHGSDWALRAAGPWHGADSDRNTPVEMADELFLRIQVHLEAMDNVAGPQMLDQLPTI